MTVRGTHRGDPLSPIGPLSPTGKSVSYTGMEWFRVASGKIVEVRTYWDHLSLLRQLDALPAPGPSAG